MALDPTPAAASGTGVSPAAAPEAVAAPLRPYLTLGWGASLALVFCLALSWWSCAVPASCLGSGRLPCLLGHWFANCPSAEQEKQRPFMVVSANTAWNLPLEAWCRMRRRLRPLPWRGDRPWVEPWESAQSPVPLGLRRLSSQHENLKLCEHHLGIRLHSLYA